MDSKRMKEWIENNLLTILSLIIPSVGSLWAIAYGRIMEVLSWLDFYLLLILCIVFFLICVKSLWNKISYKSYHYPWLKIRTLYNYTVEEKKITYTRAEGDILKYSRTMNIKCCSNRVDSIFDKYIWTGNQVNAIDIKPMKGIVNIKNKSRIGIWHYFLIELNNHMEKGDTKEISYKWPDIPDCSKSSPFFSASTDEPTKKIILALDLGEEYGGQEIICEEFRAIESDYPIYKQEGKLNERGQYTWEIPPHKIKRFRHYRIRWSWNKGQPAAEME